MKISLDWQGKMKFGATDGRNSLVMDTTPPIGEGTALSPKQLALAGVAGCSAMDVMSLLKKHKQEVKSFRIESDAPTTEGYPSVFQFVHLDYYLEGNITREHAIDAVHLSQSKFCGVSAMMAKSCPIHYTIYLNGAEIHRGEAQFP